MFKVTNKKMPLHVQKVFTENPQMYNLRTPEGKLT